MNRKSYIMLIALVSTVVNSGGYLKKPFEEEVTEANLIIEGVLLEKSSKNEQVTRYVTDQNNQIVSTISESIFTTFIFSVDKVLRGDYKLRRIKVMMLGGCDYDLGWCDEYSFNYDYENGEKAVLFLNYADNINAFQTTQGSNTAFSLTSDGELLRKSDSEESTYILTINNDGKFVSKNSMTLNLLQTEINEIEQKNEK